jgi:hypothetical protein
MTKVLKCLRCSSTMEPGFILDRSSINDMPVKNVSEWVEGTPQEGFWTGLKTEVKLKVATYRCSGCGYLESYAM